MFYTVTINFKNRDYIGKKRLVLENMYTFDVLYYNGREWLRFLPFEHTDKIYCMSEIESFKVTPVESR